MDYQEINHRVDILIEQYKRYSLKKFKEILKELLQFVGSIERLKGKKILELGPGQRINLLRFLFTETEADTVIGVGKEANWFVFRQREFKEKRIRDNFLPDYLKHFSKNSIDLIYSRYFFEQYSINPRVLLTSKVYWQYVAQDKFKNQGTDFPASMENLREILREIIRILKPGGILISHIAKKFATVLTEENLKEFNLKQVNRRNLGKISEIITLIK